MNFQCLGEHFWRQGHCHPGSLESKFMSLRGAGLYGDMGSNTALQLVSCLFIFQIQLWRRESKPRRSLATTVVIEQDVVW